MKEVNRGPLSVAMALGRPYLENSERKISTVFLAVVVAICMTFDHFEKASIIIIFIFPLNGPANQCGLSPMPDLVFSMGGVVFSLGCL